MEFIRVPSGMSSVYASLSAKQGPALIHWPDWAASGDVVFMLPLVSGAQLSKHGTCFRNLRVGGSDYRLFYKRDHRVECITIEPLDRVSRPLSTAREAAPVNYLHFYRPLGETKWRQLMPNQDVKLDEIAAAALANAA